MPAVTIGIIRVPFRGRIVKIPGDRTYEEWTFTIYDGFREDVEFRNKFLKWNNTLNDHADNIPKKPFQVNGGINMMEVDTFTQWAVHQLDLAGTVKRSVVLVNCWPTVVGELVLNYDTSDTISEYSVTLAYDYLKNYADTPEDTGKGDIDAAPEEKEVEGNDTVPGEGSHLA